MREIDFPKENVHDTSSEVLRRHDKVVHRDQRDGRRLVEENSGVDKTIAPRDGRKLVEQHPGQRAKIADRDHRRLGPDGPYNATSKIEAQRVVKAAEETAKKELLHTALTKQEQELRSLTSAEQELLRIHREERNNEEDLNAQPQEAEEKVEWEEGTCQEDDDFSF